MTSRSGRTPGTGRRGSAWAAYLLVLILLLAGVSCSSGDSSDSVPSDDSSPDETTSSSTAEGTATTYASVQDEIADRYRGFWAARLAANSPPNPDDPALREFATGAQLDHVVGETQAHLASGVAIRAADQPANFRRVDVIELNGDQAVIQDCVVSDGVVYRIDTGEIVDDRVTTYNLRGEMNRVDGVWRLAKVTEVQHWDGVAGCALAP